jgi:ABC-type protease/lipase transport system fused ATPase/permease subunit
MKQLSRKAARRCPTDIVSVSQFARAVLRDTPILILDEPTASLDAISERAVVEALQRAAHGRTTLTIAHRLSTVRFANRVIVMKAGRESSRMEVRISCSKAKEPMLVCTSYSLRHPEGNRATV